MKIVDKKIKIQSFLLLIIYYLCKLKNITLCQKLVDFMESLSTIKPLD